MKKSDIENLVRELDKRLQAVMDEASKFGITISANNPQQSDAWKMGFRGGVLYCRKHIGEEFNKTMEEAGFGHCITK